MKTKAGFRFPISLGSANPLFVFWLYGGAETWLQSSEESYPQRKKVINNEKKLLTSNKSKCILTHVQRKHDGAEAGWEQKRKRGRNRESGTCGTGKGGYA